MLDTVKIQIPSFFRIPDNEVFTPSAKYIFNTKKGFMKAINNPTADDKKKGIYKPRLTLIRRAGAIFLTIEFSVPKLLYGNNLDEISEEQFNEVIRVLKEKLEDMGVIVPIKVLENAKVLVFHPSKNIILTKGYTASFAIREIMKTDIDKRLDVNETKFRNNGHALQLYSQASSLVFYDKINDLNKPERRAIGTEQRIQQLSLFEFLKEQKKLEVLRIEARLCATWKMKSLFKKLNLPIKLTFKDILKEDICQKILIDYWEQITKDSNLYIFNIESNPLKILEKILINYPHIKPVKALRFVGLYMLSRDKQGIRGLRKALELNRSKYAWPVIKKDIVNFNPDKFPIKPYGFVEEVTKCLEEFKSFRTKKDTIEITN